MKRTVNNLDRLYQKMLARYGSDDATVIQLRQELDLCQRQLASDEGLDLPQMPIASPQPALRQGAGMTYA